MTTPIGYDTKDPGPRGSRQGPRTELQRALLRRDPSSLPRFRDDGHVGMETWTAVALVGRTLGILVPKPAPGVNLPEKLVTAIMNDAAPAIQVPADRGLLLNGAIVPNSQWIRRDPRAWWSPGERGTRPRAAEIDLLMGHWTAGPTRTGSDAAARVVQSMKARKRPDGSPMNVGITFVISWDGIVTQTMDLSVACVQVGTGAVNRRALGVETCNPGTAAQARALNITGPFKTVYVAGRAIEILPPSDAIVASWQQLANFLVGLNGIGGIRIPKAKPPSTKRWTVAEQTVWKGVQEHCHVAKSNKIDAAGQLVGALCSW